VIVINWF